MKADQDALRSELAAAQEERKNVQAQLEDMSTRAGEWWEKAKLAQEEIERLHSQSRPAADPELIALLQDALLLKANAGGAIKREIEKALALLTSAER